MPHTNRPKAGESLAFDAQWGREHLVSKKDWVVLWERVDDSYYSGSAQVLLASPSNEPEAYCFVEWGWGSCEVCDPWYGLSDAEMDAEVERDQRPMSRDEIIDLVGAQEGKTLTYGEKQVGTMARDTVVAYLQERVSNAAHR